MGEETLIELCAAADVKEGKPVRIARDGYPVVAVYRVDGDLLIADDACTHAGISLSEWGAVSGAVVTCSWHFWRFDLRTGEPLGLPCSLALRTYTPIVKDGVIYFNGQPRLKAG